MAGNVDPGVEVSETTFDGIIKPTDWNTLRTAVNNVMNKRNGKDPLTSFGGTAYNYTTTPAADGIIKKEHYMKNAVPMANLTYTQGTIIPDFSVADMIARLALPTATTPIGTIVYQIDNTTCYRLTATPVSTNSNWVVQDTNGGVETTLNKPVGKAVTTGISDLDYLQTAATAAYAVNVLSQNVDSTKENYMENSDCVGGCAGTCITICTGQCVNACSGTCTGGCGNNCTGTCTGTCTGGCTNTCTSSCSTGCADGCTGDCGTNCELACSDGCTGSCGTTCNKACSTCSTSCGTTCDKGCADGCTGDCNDGCSDQCAEQCNSNCSGSCGDCDTTCSTECADWCSLSCGGACAPNCSGTCTGGCTGCTGTCNTTCQGQCGNNCSGMVDID